MLLRSFIWWKISYLCIDLKDEKGNGHELMSHINAFEQETHLLVLLELCSPITLAF